MSTSQKSVIFCSDAECRGCLGEANQIESMLRDRVTRLTWFARDCPGFGTESFILGNSPVLGKLGCLVPLYENSELNIEQTKGCFCMIDPKKFNVFPSILLCSVSVKRIFVSG